MENRRGKVVISDRFPILGLQNQCGRWLKPWNQKMIASWQESDDKPRQCIEKQRHYSAKKEKKSILSRLWSSLEKAMAPHSSTLAWKIPWAEEPGRLQSMGLRRVEHDWVNSLSVFTFIHWRRKWQLTPVFLPGESQGWQSLVGCCLWGRAESDTTEVT